MKFEDIDDDSDSIFFEDPLDEVEDEQINEASDEELLKLAKKITNYGNIYVPVKQLAAKLIDRAGVSTEQALKVAKMIFKESKEQLHLFDHDTNVRLGLELPDYLKKEYPSAAKAVEKKQKSKEQLDLEAQLKRAYQVFNINGAKKNSIYWNNIVELMKKLDKFR